MSVEQDQARVLDAVQGHVAQTLFQDWSTVAAWIALTLDGVRTADGEPVSSP
jgi:hypothetical protein